jgi:hypothetical protein
MLRRPKRSKIEVVAPKEEGITVDERFKTYLLLHLPPGVTFRRSTFFPQRAFFFVSNRSQSNHRTLLY